MASISFKTCSFSLWFHLFPNPSEPKCVTINHTRKVLIVIVLVCTRVHLWFWHLRKRTAARGENKWEFDLKGLNTTGVKTPLLCFFHFFVAWVVCFGSLSCWKTYPQLIFSPPVEKKRFLSKILRYMTLSFVPSMRWNCSVPLSEKQHLFPLLCLTGEMVWTCGGLMVSSDHSTVSQAFSKLFRCLIGKLKPVHAPSWAERPYRHCKISID